MRLATIRTATGTRAVRVDETQAVETGDADVRALLERTDWAAHAAAAAGPVHAVDGLDYAPLVPAPEKILCVGQNYRDHIAEMGNEPPAYPTIFAKFAPALVGAYDDIVLPAVSDAVDYEAELAVVIGRPVRHATPEQAGPRSPATPCSTTSACATGSSAPPSSCRARRSSARRRSGRAWSRPDELPAGGWEISTVIDGETRQRSDTGQLVFGVVDLVAYLSTILTLNPGDVIATGTPGGVGPRAQAPALPRPTARRW